MHNGTGVPGGDHDIAVIGLSLRLPGSRTPDEFWDHLARGRSLITEVPEHRGHRHDRPGHPPRDCDATGSVWGGFIDDADCFDADFFRISPREARSMHPQQRIALELSWHALEDAGYRADRLAGPRTGVFMAACHADHAELIEREAEETGACHPAAAAHAVIAGRVSRHFGFHGPGAAGDTASAGSLVAVEQAVRALRRGDCDHALAGGVNLSWSTRHFTALAKAGMASPGGRYRAFDAQAGGYVRGEGGAVLLLKRAADARRAGDAVHALIKGIASHHGGRAGSLTVTDPAAQAELIAAVHRRAGIAPETVTYVETHGPGTPVGDPIEIRGLQQAFADLHENRPGTAAGSPRTGQDRTAAARGHRCGVGSVKTTTGHLEGAAGIVGMLKVILAMRHRKLPATVGFEKLDPHIELDGSPLYIVDRLTDWTAGPRGTVTGAPAPLRAGVSSFGFDGTSAHVLLESGAPGNPAAGPGDAPAGTDDGEQWLPVSAMDEDRLRATCAGLARWVRTRLGQDDAPALADIARTLRRGRVPMPERVVFRASGLAEWAAQLEGLAAGEERPAGCLRGRAGTDTPGGPGTDDLAAVAARRLWLGRPGEFAAAWVQGLPVDWEQVTGHGRRVHLPGYAFARTPHRFTPATRPQAAPDRHGTAPPSARRDGRSRGHGPAAPAAPPALTGREGHAAPAPPAETRARLRPAGGDGDGWSVVAPGPPDCPAHASLAELLKTAARETSPSTTGKFVILGGYGRKEDLLRDGGIYWVTGDADGLGLLLAERLCERHHATVVVGGRPEHSPAVDALQVRVPHGEVTYRCADVTDADAVQAAVSDIRLQYGRLDGVFHAAGVPGDGLLVAGPVVTDAAASVPVMNGAAHVEAATRGLALDFLLLFGSVAGTGGSTAQDDHATVRAAARAFPDAFPDAFAVRRRASAA
ncbi:SDR family NAD(P)-dependent oxidoreductase [Streptomyces sp. URMC 127]|uniref:SDR family NAD(P)-dependent oxidoreductase n=1 Tax=Streptomyces sp. URMC 127 TaxID=3423402 RepID=UPI003F1AA34D